MQPTFILIGHIIFINRLKLLKHVEAVVVMIMIIWQLDLQLSVQAVPINTKVVSSNPVHSEVCSIQHYMIKFVSDLRQVSGFLQVLRFPPPIKTDCHDIAEILLKVALNIITRQKHIFLYSIFVLQFNNLLICVVQ